MIPLPARIPDEDCNGGYMHWLSSEDESTLLKSIINYDDFAIVISDAAKEKWTERI